MKIAKFFSKVDEVGDGNIDIVDIELKRSLTLTAADLRFVDFVLKEMEANAKSPSMLFVHTRNHYCATELIIPILFGK